MRKVYWLKIYNAVPVELSPEEFNVLGDMLNDKDNLTALNLIKNETTILDDNKDLEGILRCPKVLVYLDVTPTIDVEDNDVSLGK